MTEKKRNHFLILGDSYSTFGGWIPQGYAAYYTQGNGCDTDVKSVEETWWHRFAQDTGATLVQNNSWSGSTICFTGYEGDCSETSSFLCRLRKLAKAGFFRDNEIDTVFIFGGTNDGWANSPVGELMFSDWKKDDLFSVLPAVCCLLHEVQTAAPKAEIVVLINTEMKDEIADGIAAACEHAHARALRLHDIDKAGGHPTVKGMRQIEQQLLEFLE